LPPQSMMSIAKSKSSIKIVERESRAAWMGRNVAPRWNVFEIMCESEKEVNQNIGGDREYWNRNFESKPLNNMNAK
jgi:hypothetical protein